MAGQKGLVSVLTPAYNRREFMEQTVHSVLSQSYPEVEYIVVDDGSTDGTYELLRDFENQGKLTLLAHENHANRGQSASLNLALKQARGEFIAILDSDDVFAPDKLDRQVEFLNHNPEIGMVYGQAMTMSESGEALFTIPAEGHRETSDPNNLLLDCYMALPGGALVRKSVFDRVGGFEESFRASQDHDMAVRIAEAAPFAYMPGVVFYYRKHGGSISTNGLARRWMTGFQILERAASRYPYRKSTLRKRKALLHFRMAQVHWSDSRHLKALFLLMRSGFGDPARAFKVISGLEKIR